jgi:hypothetical protein
MSKLSEALGKKYEENRLSVLTRTFELGNHTFKVRVPSVQEIEKIYNYANNPNEEKVEKEYKNIIAGFEKDEINGDVVIEGRSMKETAKNKEVLRYRIVEYFKFIIPETGSLDDLTYEDIESEFPLAVQLTIVEKINEVISPDYRETRSK